MAYVNLSKMPSPHQEYTANLSMLNGGLNLSELEYRLKNNESPAMKNLMWREGVLCSRDGQEWVGASAGDIGYSMYERLFNGFIVAHIGTNLYYMDPTAESPAFTSLLIGTNPVRRSRGSWFTYNGKLYYKNYKGYFAITYTPGDPNANPPTGPYLSATKIDSTNAYTPVIVINASPSNGSGSLYQPENRISAAKTVWYNKATDSNNDPIRVYHLPVTEINSVELVEVDGSAIEESTTTPPAANKYYADLNAGTITFGSSVPLAPTDPPTNNTVKITYSKANTEYYNSVMDCSIAATYGGTGELCIVMAGCPAQPNAIFWSGNDSFSMKDNYFPASQYQLCGSTDDPVTGLGKQQSFLVVFKERSVGRVKQDTAEVDGRITIDMPYIAINDKIGCDLPYSIQLIDNNLVWCSKEQGVHFLKDSSYAYENNIECISNKINGGPRVKGLLANVRSGDKYKICSLDDTRRYYLCCGGEVWVWDYENTSYKDPSWYYFTDINAVAFSSELDDVWHLNANGRLTHFTRGYADYGSAIVKSYRFASQYFGSYDRLKNVNSVIVAVRPDTSSTALLTYITDYETREDLTILDHRIWQLVPRNLEWRSLLGTGFGAVYRRRPMCRGVKHFAMQLDNAEVGQDLSIVSAQIFYNFQGRFR